MDLAAMASAAERVMAQEKAIVMVRTLVTRKRHHMTLLRQSRERIDACKGIIARAPTEGRHLQPTLDFWIRQYAYHERAHAECVQLDNELRANMSATDIQVAVSS